MLGRGLAQDLADAVVDRRVGRMVLAVHLEVDAQRRPARAEIGLPLQLALTARDRQRPFAPRLVVEGDGALLRVDMLDRHVEHPARLGMDRQEDRIGLLALLAQGRQHHLHQRVIAFGGQQQRLVELAGLVEIGRRIELVLEPEGVEEAAQHRVVVMPEAFEFPERVGHACQRHLQIVAQHLGVRHVLGDLAHPVHVVGKADQPCRDVADRLEGAADHRGAQHLAEGADVRQARGAIARLEQHISLFRRRGLVAFENPARFLEGPGFRTHRGIAQIGHLGSLSCRGVAADPASY